MARSLRKSVKISDEGFLTSLKRQLSKTGHSIETILANEIPASQGQPTIQRLRATLSRPTYGIDEEDVERLCQMAEEKCATAGAPGAFDVSKLASLV